MPEGRSFNFTTLKPGITRLDHGKTAKGYLIRLFYVNGKHLYKELIKDSEFDGGEPAARRAAIRIRNLKYKEYVLSGQVPGHKRIARPKKPKKNSEKVIGVSRVKTGWRVAWSERLKGRGVRTITIFDKDHENDSYKSFIAAVHYKYDRDMELYGVSYQTPYSVKRLYKPMMLRYALQQSNKDKE